MPTLSTSRGIVSICQECREAFTDIPNELSIFNTGSCLSCQELEQLLKDSDVFIPGASCDGQTVSFAVEEYAFSI